MIADLHMWYYIGSARAGGRWASSWLILLSSWCHLGSSWRHLGAILVSSWGHLGSSWLTLANLGSSWLILASPWHRLGSRCRHLGVQRALGAVIFEPHYDPQNSSASNHKNHKRANLFWHNLLHIFLHASSLPLPNTRTGLEKMSFSTLASLLLD